MYTADYFIQKLDMIPHQEGGFYKEIEASNQNTQLNEDGRETQEIRKLWTSIYFLLRDGEVSNFHRLKSDEMWYYHAGSSLTIYMINPNGELITKELGLDVEKGRTASGFSSKRIYIWFSHEQRRLCFGGLYGISRL